jgi:hypothetical protein
MSVQQRFGQVKILHYCQFMVLLTSLRDNKYFLRCAPGKKLLNPPKRGGTLLL